MKRCVKIETIHPLERIKHLYLVEEKTLQEIGNVFDVDHTTIKRCLERNNIEIRRSWSKIKPGHKEAIKIAYIDTQSAYKVEKLFPYGRKAITNYLKSAGLMTEEVKTKEKPYIVLEHGVYKKGINNFLFARNEFGEWKRSNNKKAMEELGAR